MGGVRDALNAAASAGGSGARRLAGVEGREYLLGREEEGEAAVVKEEGVEQQQQRQQGGQARDVEEGQRQQSGDGGSQQGQGLPAGAGPGPVGGSTEVLDISFDIGGSSSGECPLHQHVKFLCPGCVPTELTVPP